ncbi:hypothetical protein [Streptomyces sp. NPDC002785]|uniref:hypothetical protein n=1 Tax=Streptomyces sp. NPDC002785 TaxID=3154543 RepID=UPI00331A75AC
MTRHAAGQATMVAALSIAVVHSIGVLPMQIRWAETVPGANLNQGNFFPAFPLDMATPFSTAARMLTVSPVWLLGDRVGTAALLREAVWLTVFVTVLCAVTSALAPRLGGQRFSAASHAVALVTLAPVVHTVTLLIVSAPQIFTETGPRGEIADMMGGSQAPLAQTLADARAGAPHAVWLGTVSAATVMVSALIRRARAASARPSVRRVVLLTLAVLRGPASTVWRRIGETLLAAGTGYAFLRLFESDWLTVALPKVLVFFCTGENHTDICGDQLAEVFLREPSPPLIGEVEQVYAELVDSMVKPIAYAWFAIVFAGVFFVLRSLPSLRRVPVQATGLLISFWAAYTAGTVAYAFYVVPFGTGPSTTPGQPSVLYSVLPLLLLGLHNAVFTAPAAALIATGVATLRRRLWKVWA